MEVAGQVGRVLRVGEYEDVAAWLSASVGMCAIQRLLWGCGEVFRLICREGQGAVMPGGYGVWKSHEGCFSRIIGYVFFRPQWEGHGVAVYNSFDLEAVT